MNSIHLKNQPLDLVIEITRNHDSDGRHYTCTAVQDESTVLGRNGNCASKCSNQCGDCVMSLNEFPNPWPLSEETKIMSPILTAYSLDYSNISSRNLLDDEHLEKCRKKTQSISIEYKSSTSTSQSHTRLNMRVQELKIKKNQIENQYRRNMYALLKRPLIKSTKEISSAKLGDSVVCREMSSSSYKNDTELSKLQIVFEAVLAIVCSSVFAYTVYSFYDLRNVSLSTAIDGYSTPEYMTRT